MININIIGVVSDTKAEEKEYYTKALNIYSKLRQYEIVDMMRQEK